MHASAKEVVTECTQGSDDGRLTFPEVVMKLIGAGVERYHADLYRGETTYYLPDGDSLLVPNAAIKAKPAQEFSASSVKAAVRAIQRGQLGYVEFCEMIAAA